MSVVIDGVKHCLLQRWQISLNSFNSLNCYYSTTGFLVWHFNFQRIQPNVNFFHGWVVAIKNVLKQNAAEINAWIVRHGVSYNVHLLLYTWNAKNICSQRKPEYKGLWMRLQWREISKYCSKINRCLTWCIGVLAINGLAASPFNSKVIGISVDHDHLGFNGGHYRCVCKYGVIQMLRTEACNLTCFQE